MQKTHGAGRPAKRLVTAFAAAVAVVTISAAALVLVA
jgi:hypothetical protein